MVWNKVNLENHLRKQHEASLEEYFERHKNNINLPVHNIIDENLFRSSNSSPNNAWANRCIFKCVICDPQCEFKSKRRFASHLSSTHGMKNKEYVEKYGKTMSHVEKHVSVGRLSICGCVTSQYCSTIPK